MKNPTRRTTSVSVNKTLNAYIADWTLFERVWLVTFTAITIALFLAWHDTWIGLAAALTGMLCVVLTAKGKISSYYVGIPNILLYAWIAYQNNYLGEVQLNMLYFLPMSVLGIALWRRHRDQRKSADDVVVRVLSTRERIAWSIIVITAIIAYGRFLGWLRGSIPYVDAATNVLSVLAMLLLVQRAVEQWVAWILVDILTIFLWLRAFLADGNDSTILVMWIAYLVNAVYGLHNWIRLYQRRPTR